MKRSDKLRQQRYRTAIGRVTLSRPFALAIHDQLVGKKTRILDYGSGRGTDVTALTRLGMKAVGWDPVHSPNQRLRKSDVVNLGFVVNVIEDPVERVEVLRRAFSFTKQLLIVSSRMEWDRQPISTRKHRDGLVTSTGTFQKFFEQEELRHWIDNALTVSSIAAGPGIFYIFVHEPSAQRFLARRFLKGTRTPSIKISERLVSQHREALKPLIQFFAAHGRLPKPEEYDFWVKAILTTFGSLKRAFRIMERVTDPEDWKALRLKRERELLVFGALSEFERRVKFGELPIEFRYDIRALFGSYKQLRAASRPLLFATGQPEVLNLGFEAAAVGKLTQNALYVHASALGELPPVLRIYEGCATQLAGSIPDVTIIKLHRYKSAISYLSYPHFDRDPHPALTRTVIVDLQHMTITQRHYQNSENPPILHRKELLVDSDYRLYKCFQKLTLQEERLELLNSKLPIGTRSDWQRLLKSRSVKLTGHRVVPATAQKPTNKKRGSAG